MSVLVALPSYAAGRECCTYVRRSAPYSINVTAGDNKHVTTCLTYCLQRMRRAAFIIKQNDNRQPALSDVTFRRVAAYLLARCLSLSLDEHRVMNNASVSRHSSSPYCQ